jgi:rhamnose transport system permease protein
MFLLAVLVLIYAGNAALSPAFLSLGNQVNLIQLSVEKAILALLMAFVIINAEIDLSVGSMMGLSACAFGTLVDGGLPAALACLLCLGIGLGGGLLNGAFVAYLGLPSLVVTLATLIGFRGAARVLLEDRAVGGFPDWFEGLGQRGLVGPLPLGLLSFALLFLVLAVVLGRSGFGRKTYVIGTSREVAEFAGIDTARHKLLIFAASGLVAAYAGLLFAARVGAVRGDVGTGFELDVITMVLLGGVSIFGGSGTLAGVGLAVLIVLSLRNGMSLLNVTGHVQTGVIGLLLILSVLVPRLGTRLWRRAPA